MMMSKQFGSITIITLQLQEVYPDNKQEVESEEGDTVNGQKATTVQCIMCTSVSVCEYISTSVSVCDDVYNVCIIGLSYQFEKPLQESDFRQSHLRLDFGLFVQISPYTNHHPYT